MTEATGAPTLKDVEQLRNQLTADLQGFGHPRILGAQLGTRLNNAMSPSNFKAWLRDGNQNLRDLAEQSLAGIVPPTDERQGLDFFFKIEGRQPGAGSFSGELWKAFCTSRPARSILFDIVSNSLRLCGAGDFPTSTESTIPQISAEEHREMCLAFVRQLSTYGPTAARLQELAESYQPSEYAIWVATLKSQTGLFKTWGTFRVAHIKKMFSERLSALNVEEGNRIRLENEFQADYERQRSNKPRLPIPPSQTASPETTVAKAGDEGGREALMNAIKTLADAELARILVPLDVVATLLKNTKR